MLDVVTAAADQVADDSSQPESYDSAALVRRLNRIEGQVRGIRRMIEEPRDCIEILQCSATTSITAFTTPWPRAMANTGSSFTSSSTFSTGLASSATSPLCRVVLVAASAHVIEHHVDDYARHRDEQPDRQCDSCDSSMRLVVAYEAAA